MPPQFLTEIPGPSEAELENWQYTAYPDEVAEYPPPSIVTGSVSAQPGAFIANPLNDERLKYVTAARTTIIFVTDSNGGENIVPVRSAWEEESLPHETRQYLPLHSALTMIGQENLESATVTKKVLKSDHTHPTAPHLGIFSSRRTKEEYRKHQIGEEPATDKLRGPVDPDSLTKDDGVTWK